MPAIGGLEVLSLLSLRAENRASSPVEVLWSGHERSRNHFVRERLALVDSLRLTRPPPPTRPHRAGTVATAHPIDPRTAHLAHVAAALRTEFNGFGAPQHRALRHMWRAGEILLTVRSRLPHGEWQPWLESAGTDPGTAQRLMTLRQRCRTLHDVVRHLSATELPADAHARNEPLELAGLEVQNRRTEPPPPQRLDKPAKPQADTGELRSLVAGILDRVRAVLTPGRQSSDRHQLR